MGAAPWAVWTALRTEQRAMRGSPLVIIGSAVQPAVFLVVTMGTRSPAAGRATWLVSAVMLTAMWSSTVWMAGGVLRRERTYGTLARCVSGVHGPQLVLLGKSFGATLYSTAVILVSTAVTVAVLGIPVRVEHPVWVLVALLTAIASGTALGMLVSCLFLLTEHGLAWSSALMYPVFIVGGLLIPHDTLPVWLQWVSAGVSLRWIHEFLSGAASGTVDLWPLAAAIGLTVVYSAVASWSLGRSVDQARRKGTLDLV
ncbi:ABC transporter permease [Streptomyces sp. NPDC090052]|uniref:ABC transporter permease n=1 Tax=unclassified Streptomyces TaxID=2593676 RepID=UPI00224E3D7F|nr:MULTISPECIES: ABC transporter permease [unclassified Streptomyces]MCX4722404.1 ABC transporter permease [Streptomyces sp. NBC_01306]WSV09195.1 ABC transporter permease [Streptomyces sp. NBC_01020]WSX47215.1 ABC transporter permease [Streptomyces sp. NBC_00963]WSX71942.1 ABC transporter permease [Streptomyces sp. NBC_00932]